MQDVTSLQLMHLLLGQIAEVVSMMLGCIPQAGNQVLRLLLAAARFCRSCCQ